MRGSPIFFLLIVSAISIVSSKNVTQLPGGPDWTKVIAALDSDSNYTGYTVMIGDRSSSAPLLIYDRGPTTVPPDLLTTCLLIIVR